MVFDALIQDALLGTPTNVSRRQSKVNNQLGPTGRFQLNQAIERRAGLRFNYAYGVGQVEDIRTSHQILYKTGTSKAPAVRWLPFYENPLIAESRKANYASTPIFLRNEPVRLYTGSQPRVFKVDVHYSIYHMAMMCPTSELLKIYTGEDREFMDDELIAIRKYVNDTVQQDVGQYNTQGQFNVQEAIKQIHERAADGSEGPYGPIPANADAQFNAFLTYTVANTAKYQEIFGLINYAVNNIRNSVISTSRAPVKGPPIVELKWGTMYNFVPCIITDYRIQPIEEAGYDPKSLMSQRLKISLTMEEFHNVHGNLWGDPDITGTLPGWDTVMELGGMDVNQTGNGKAPFATGYQSVKDRYGGEGRVSNPPPTITEGPK